MSVREAGISVIIPVLNEAAVLPRCIEAVRRAGDAEIIVADGGSVDGTVDLAHDLGVPVTRSARGRGRQMNAGAALARGELLLFLHADCLLSPDALKAIRRAFRDPALQIATFRRRFDDASFWLRVSEFFSRFDTVWTRFGDQGIILRRSFFENLGGFPNWPLLEDVELLRAARRRVRSPVLPATILVSSRRFQRTGVVRGQLRNAGWLLRHLLGASAEEIAAEYCRSGRQGRPEPVREVTDVSMIDTP